MEGSGGRKEQKQEEQEEEEEEEEDPYVPAPLDQRLGTASLLALGTGISIAGGLAALWGVRRGMRNAEKLDKTLTKRLKPGKPKTRTGVRDASGKITNPTPRAERKVEAGAEEAVGVSAEVRGAGAGVARKAFLYATALSTGTFALGTLVVSYAMDVSTVGF
jgi:hypothetical protein